jgi:MFS family permease
MLGIAVELGIAFVLLLVCPLVTAFIADRKGRGVLPWAMIGLFLGIFGILLAALVPRSAEARV